ncbi:ferritin [Plakobranchus ocellatus]|uniref:Ferritin n=1 Tax=Plakobranchus ocellatus TaxID=259542 RepID=A0AAV4E297_9GAST|nr:ferritin [Plakobranchus ocellatus]
MRRSDRRRRRDLYRCVNNKWTRVENIQGYCKTTVTVKEAQQNLHHTVELNELTNSLIQASFCYLTMASLYERADVALPGFNKLMTKLWEEDMKHARELMKYVNKRGGYINIEWIVS